MMMTMWMMMMMSMIMPLMKHPLSMGIILILQTILTAMMTGMMIKSFWFSYILVIIMLSGALVLFIYMASIASNEIFNFSMKMFMFIMLLMMTGIILQITNDKITNNKMNLMTKKMIMENEQLPTLMKLFNMESTSTTMLLITYLLITMIAISSIVNVFEGPMRMKN